MDKAWDDMKKTKEEEYFRKMEQEKLAAIASKKGSPGKETEKAKARMRCPKCDGTLEAVHFQGIEIDRCAGCGGVWLDAGEMERIASRESEGFFSKLMKTMR